MKKICFFFVSLVSVLSFVQCAKEQRSDIASGSTDEKIFVTFTNVGSSKSAIAEETLGKLTSRWEKGDTLYVFDGTKYCGSLDLTSGKGETTGSFTGQIVAPSGNKVKVFYFAGENPVVSGVAHYDFSSQNGTLAGINSKVIAACELDYSPGQTTFSGTLKLLFSIGKFKFDKTEFGETSSITLLGVAGTISVDNTGAVSYTALSEPTGAAITLTAKSGVAEWEDTYIALPIADGMDKVTFYNSTQHRIKIYDKQQLVNNTFYSSGTSAFPVYLDDVFVDFAAVSYKNAIAGSATVEKLNKTCTYTFTNQEGKLEEMYIPIYAPVPGYYQISYSEEVVDPQWAGGTSGHYYFSVNKGQSLPKTFSTNPFQIFFPFGSDYKPSSGMITINLKDSEPGEPNYWCWDISRIQNGKRTLKVSFQRVEKVNEDGKIQFLNTGIISAYAESSYIYYAKNDYALKFAGYTADGSEKFYIPLTGLTPPQNYKLEFTIDIDHNPNNTNYDHCYGIQTDTENKGINVAGLSGEGWAFTSNLTFDEIKSEGLWRYTEPQTDKTKLPYFTATAGTMYWVWSMASTGNGHYDKIHIYNVSLTECPN